MQELIEKRNNLVATLKEQMPLLEDLLASVRDERTYEDRIYRFYHCSYKVYDLQVSTEEIVIAFLALSPEQKLNNMFMTIIQEGTGKVFAMEDNQQWMKATRPIIEAFLHATYFLEMVVKYGKQPDSTEGAYPSGWAAVLTLFDLL